MSLFCSDFILFSILIENRLENNGDILEADWNIK